VTEAALNQLRPLRYIDITPVNCSLTSAIGSKTATQVLVAARQLDQVVGHIPALAVEHIRGKGEAATADLEQEAQRSGIVRPRIANSLSEQASGLTSDLKRKKSF